MYYTLRSGCMPALRLDKSTLTLPKNATVRYAGPTREEASFEKRKGQVIHALEFQGEVVFVYTSVQKIFPIKDSDVWFDNFWNVMFGPLTVAE